MAMSKGNNLKRLLSVLFVTVAAVGVSVAFLASSSSAQNNTINGAFCMPTMVMFCMQATFDGQTAEGYTNHEAALSLSPGTYSLTVNDDSAAHDFAFRSCPGSTSPCVAGANVAAEELTSMPFAGGEMTFSLPLTSGTYRLFCDVGNRGNFAATGFHEAQGMFVDIVVGADNPGGNLQGANLEKAFLPSVNLNGANLQRADGSGGNFRGTQLQRANMQLGSYENADFTGADLQGANLQHADFTGANLTDANLNGVNLHAANLTGANLSGASLAGANLNKVTWSNTTCPDGSNSDLDGNTCRGHL
jgi:hypothetical protein